MYLTAHRVTKASNGSTGINSFLHIHHTAIGVEATWETSNLTSIANRNPGELIAQTTALKPGENRVLSYLDIVCEDSISYQEVAKALSRCQEKISEETPFFENTGNIVILFSTIRKLSGIGKYEYSVLQDKALGLLDSFKQEQSPALNLGT